MESSARRTNSKRSLVVPAPCEGGGIGLLPGIGGLISSHRMVWLIHPSERTADFDEGLDPVTSAIPEDRCVGAWGLV